MKDFCALQGKRERSPRLVEDAARHLRHDAI
jgi:hypothetical protein